MAHKVHPKIFRLREITDWHSRGFYKKPTLLLREDFRIREFLKKNYGRMGIEKIEIERFPAKITVIISTARPGLIIGRGGEGIERLQREIKNIISPQEKREVRIEIREVKNPWSSAEFVAQNIAQQIEKRIPYRRVLKQALDKIVSQKGVEGARLEVAGRLDGAEIARREWLKKGRLPRQTIRADFDYAQAQAFCSYGVVGVKVWIYKGERFD